MALTFLVRVLLCSVVFMPSLAQNLKGSSSGIAEMGRSGFQGRPRGAES